MAITFVKDTNGKVIVDRSGTKYSLDASMNVIASSTDSELIVITDTSAPMESREVFKFGWRDVTLPVATDRNDLIEKLGKNFFFSSFSATISTTGLATEAKQNEIIQKLQLAPNSSTVNLPASLTQFTVFPSNILRKEVTIHNNTNGKLYVLKGSGVTSTNYSYPLSKDDILHINDYRGIITAIGNSAIGNIMCTETFN